MKSNKISLSIILTVLAGCVEDGDRMNLVRLVRGGEYDGSGSNNSQNKEIQLSNIVGSLSADQANSMYNGGTDVHSNDVNNNSSTTLYSYNGNDKQYYPKYLQFSDSGDGVVATTQMDYYDYDSFITSPTSLTSTNISKNRDGSINIVLQDENKQKKLNVLLGANQLKDFNKIGSYLDYGIWQYNDGLPIYAVLYGSGQLGVINNDNQRTDIALKDGKRSVEFTGKTNAVKKSNNNVTNLTGDVTIEFKANSLSNNNYGSELQSNVKLKYTGWKTIDFEQYADSNGIYNVKVDDESISINGNMNMQFNQSESHEAGIGNEGNNVNVNVYDRVVGVYNLENIPENDGTVEIIGGFAAKAKDENNYFAITPNTYNY